MNGWTFLKSVSAVGFLGKPFFWESVTCHREMFCVNNFGLVLRICIVNAMILKIIHMINLSMLEKLCLFFSSNMNKQNFMIKNPRMCVRAY